MNESKSYQQKQPPDVEFPDTPYSNASTFSYQQGSTPTSRTPKKKSRIASFVEHKEWHNANCYDELLEVLFRIHERKTSVNLEVYAGVIQFISCMYVLPVIPQKMESAGYNKDITFAVTGISSAIGCILAGLFANLPFVVAPPAAISIFLAIYLETAQLGINEGNFAVIFSGLSLILLGWPPLGTFMTRLIPSSIQVGTVVGIGLLTALAGATEVNMIITGAYTVVGLGKITPAVMLAISGVIIIAISLHYHVKGAFCLALLVGTVIWWTIENTWPSDLVEFPHLGYPQLILQDVQMGLAFPLYLDLLFLYILTLSGLVFSLSALADLIREDGTTPRNRWIFIICGLTTVLSGLLGGPPILLSPESTAGIKAGARTGLSSIVCGLLFALSVFFAPVLKAIPSAATSPVLIIVGVFLFQNVIRVDWTMIKHSVPAFCILFFIPFTYSVLEGVALGYFIYLVISLATGDLLYDFKIFWNDYSMDSEATLGGRYEVMEALDALSPPDIVHHRERSESRSLIHGTPPRPCSLLHDRHPTPYFISPLSFSEEDTLRTNENITRCLPPPGEVDGRQQQQRSFLALAVKGEQGEEQKTRYDLESQQQCQGQGQVQQQKSRGGLKKLGEGSIPIRSSSRRVPSDEDIRRISSSPRRLSMDGLDHGVQLNSGVLERSNRSFSPAANPMASSLTGGSLSFM